MYKKRLITITVAVFILLASVPNVIADPAIVFGDYPLAVIDYRSPLGSPTPNYSAVVSKWNQPRNQGTSPHKGVDLRAQEPTSLYAPYKGWVTASSYSGATNAQDIDFIVDTNGNGIKDDGNHHIIFAHLSDRIDFPANSTELYVNKGDYIGITGNKSSPGNPVGFHLHFGNCTSGGSVWYRNEPSYRHLSSANWNAGKALDAYSLVTWNNNTAAFNSYIIDNGAPTHFSEVMLYYRTTSGNWTEIGPLSQTNYNYSYNFTGKVSSGKKVQWMFRLTRDGASPRAFGPAKFYNPADDPNSVAYAYAYWENSVT